jgi:predicted DNA-binding antitoxin AbrB/MazE fold protein
MNKGGILMTKVLQAVYANGVLRPLESLPFQENELLNITVSGSPSRMPDELLDMDFIRQCEALADDSVTLEEVRAGLSKIPGSMSAEIINEREDRL